MGRFAASLSAGECPTKARAAFLRRELSSKFLGAKDARGQSLALRADLLMAQLLND
jgi:hypothetical protein